MRLAKCLSAAEEQYSEDSEIHHLGQSEVVVTRGLEQCLPCLRAVVKSLRKVHGKGCWPRSQCHSSSSRHCIHTAHTHTHTHAHTQTCSKQDRTIDCQRASPWRLWTCSKQRPQCLSNHAHWLCFHVGDLKSTNPANCETWDSSGLSPSRRSWYVITSPYCPTTLSHFFDQQLFNTLLFKLWTIKPFLLFSFSNSGL